MSYSSPEELRAAELAAKYIPPPPRGVEVHATQDGKQVNFVYCTHGDRKGWLLQLTDGEWKCVRLATRKEKQMIMEAVKEHRKLHVSQNP